MSGFRFIKHVEGKTILSSFEDPGQWASAVGALDYAKSHRGENVVLEFNGNHAEVYPHLTPQDIQRNLYQCQEAKRAAYRASPEGRKRAETEATDEARRQKDLTEALTNSPFKPDYRWRALITDSKDMKGIVVAASILSRPGMDAGTAKAEFSRLMPEWSERGAFCISYAELGIKEGWEKALEQCQAATTRSTQGRF